MPSVPPAARCWSIASPFGGFYEQLALEELGQRVVPPPAPAPLTAEERPPPAPTIGAQPALYAILLGIAAKACASGTTPPTCTPGGMSERELLAGRLCLPARGMGPLHQHQRTHQDRDRRGQRFPMPFRNPPVVERAQGIGLDPAYVYGLIRRESRFIMDARSHVGASGLMQVMPPPRAGRPRRSA